MLKYILFSTATAISLLAATTSCPSHYLEGQAPDIVNQKRTGKTKELCFEGFAVMHSGVTKTPLWSAEYLTPAKVTILAQGRGKTRQLEKKNIVGRCV